MLLMLRHILLPVWKIEQSKFGKGNFLIKISQLKCSKVIMIMLCPLFIIEKDIMLSGAVDDILRCEI